ncbi:hypothetical protein MNBD_NITROSPIRAE02-1380 [hydrothermal vent metagenome]|uniref:Ice-binding protein C-terminal domain-containing protein n=1 Tax=hydrothermal vent metagenome TaxID=652676 RepID=A0A3B1CH14_9ZZZZ
MKEYAGLTNKLLVLMAAFFLISGISVTASADDYYNYGSFNPGIGYTTGIAGYVDTSGNIEGIAGAEYLFVTGGPSYRGNHYAYTYRVETAGDPNLHPGNPDATGPIAPRTFTQVGSAYYLGNYASGHENAFYINDTGIYYGADDLGGITHWDFGWTDRTNIAPSTPVTTQTLAYDEATGNWWAGDANRNLYMYDGSSWTYQGTHKSLGGGHHDGMEIIDGKLFVSDMTSDVLAMYNLDGSIDWSTPDKEFYYSESAYVEGMGYGPNNHIWISGWVSKTFYEIGGGALQEEFEPVPEPSTLLLLGSALAGLAGFGRKRLFRKN